MEKRPISEPIQLVSPNMLYGQTLRIMLDNGKTLAIEFWKPEDPGRKIDIAIVQEFSGEKEPEDLVVVRAGKNDVELLFPKDQEKGG